MTGAAAVHGPALCELHVEGLGIIDELTVVIGDGLTAITGETGAGKTLVVGALELLLGVRADAGMVREGADEARVEGRFVDADGDEVVLARVVPAGGARSRAYVDGRLATAAELAERGASFVDLHGQHTHQALLTPAHQRDALDRFAGPAVAHALDDYRMARAQLRGIEDALASVGGDSRSRAREIDLLRFQLDEITSARIVEADEATSLESEEALLADAEAHRAALGAARDALDRALDAVGSASGALADRAPFEQLGARAAAAQAEVADLAHELRVAADGVEEDPERLAAVRARRQQLRELCRKYGATLTSVLDYAGDAETRLAVLTSHDARVAELEEARAHTVRAVRAAADALGRARRTAAAPFADAVNARLPTLGMRAAHVAVDVAATEPGGDGADAITVVLAANPGEVPRPLARVASGGELSRTLLAVRSALAGHAGRGPVLVFDEVDAGLGGEAGRAVGRTLAELSGERQVLCVTHLAQVAAFADAQLVVEKRETGGRVVAVASLALGDARVRELSRMLAGIGDSRHARRHARELLDDAAAGRFDAEVV